MARPLSTSCGKFADTAAANDFRAVGGRTAVFGPATDFGQALEPFHEAVVVAAEFFAEIVERQHEAEREAGFVRVEEAAHVEVGGAILDRAVAQEDFEGRAFALRQLERVLDVIGVDLDDFLDALQEMRRAGFDVALVTFFRDELRGVALGEEHDIGVDRAAIGVDADDVAVVVAEQAVDGGFRENLGAERFREFGEVMVVGGAEDGVAVGEGGGVAVIQADERMAVIDVEAALGDGAFVGGIADGLFAEDIGLREVFREIDGARPVLRAGEDARFDDEHGDLRFGQRDGGGDAGGTRAHDDDVVFPGSHGRIIGSPRHLESFPENIAWRGELL